MKHMADFLIIAVLCGSLFYTTSYVEYEDEYGDDRTTEYDDLGMVDLFYSVDTAENI